MAEGIETFRSFLDRLRSTEMGVVRPGDLSFVPGRLAPDIKEHLLSYYADVTVEHSVQDPFGQIFDCVPVGSQPAARLFDKPPQPPEPDAPSSGFEALVKSMGASVPSCPPGTVPLLRLSLEKAGRYSNLTDFLTLGRSKLKPPSGQEEEQGNHLLLAAGSHKYATAYQRVPNQGGRSFINLWKLSLGNGQLLSLSQIWCSAGIGAGQMIQTVEAGWQVCPANFPSSYGNPVFFIYWNPNFGRRPAYNNSDGCFYITSSAFPIGGIFGQTSTSGGQQLEIDVSYRLSNGDWWLYVGGVALGVWKGALFNGGPMSHGCEEIMIGGETAGGGSYPPMGSGALANAGYGQAAYHRGISYFDPVRGEVPAALQSSAPTPAEYTITLGQPAPAPGQNWETYAYFGGPGGP